MSFEIRQGDVIEKLREMPEASFDGCLTDPPYGLTQGKKGGSGPKSVNLESPYGRARITTGFMGMAWDGCVPGPEVWSEVLRVLKPGAFLLAFGGTRTHHRLMCAIEDAGFEIRDCMMWLYASGFPKSLNFAGRGTALKPAYEPIILAMRPCDGTFSQNLEKHGVGGLDIDGARIACEPGTNLNGGRISSTAEGWDRPWKQDPEAVAAAHERGADAVAKAEALGRWPANIIHDGSEDVLARFPDAPGQLADASTNADQRKTQNVYGAMKRGSHEVSAMKRYTDSGGTNFAALPGARRADSGSASRFFYCAKASGAERDGNTHPTVKPVDLCRYLAKLILPPDRDAPRRLLIPYSGSGSEMIGSEIAGWDEIVGIEREPAYVKIAESRLAQRMPLFA